MAPHSSTLAWKIPWTEEPGGLQSMGSLRVGNDCATSLSLFTSMNWRRKWQPTPVFLPRESQGQGSLVGYLLWGHMESDTTEATQQQQQWEVLALGTTMYFLTAKAVFKAANLTLDLGSSFVNRGIADLKVQVLVAQWCLTLCNPIDSSPPGSSATEISRQEYWIAVDL